MNEERERRTPVGLGKGKTVREIWTTVGSRTQKKTLKIKFVFDACRKQNLSEKSPS